MATSPGEDYDNYFNKNTYERQALTPSRHGGRALAEKAKARLREFEDLKQKLLSEPTAKAAPVKG